MTEQIRVLHVDDPDFTELLARSLPREDDRLEVLTAHSAREALTALDGDVDCLVSDYEMPGTDGLELLETVREDRPELPFVLFTGKGSEAVASEAISAGATDYLRKRTGTDQFALLANRVGNAVEARRASVKASERKQRLARVLETVPSCVVQLDRDGEFVFANDRAKRVLGLERDSVTGRAYDDPEWEIRTLDGDPIPDDRLPFARVLETGEPVDDFRHSIAWPDGTRRVLSVRGAPLFDEEDEVEWVILSMQDVTERRERERELKATEERIDTVVSNVPIVLFAVDADGVFTLSEGRGLAKLGLEPGEVVGESMFDFYADNPDVLDAVELALDGETVKRVIDVDGIYFETAYQPVTDDAGTVTGAIGVAIDITERRERRLELRREKERSEELVGAVSHDLRNPLSVALARLELAAEECDSAYLEDVEAALDRIEELIGDLLTLADSGEAVEEFDAVNLQQVAEACWRNVATCDAALTVETTGTVAADRGQLRRLLENLMGNAVDHAGERVTVRVGCHEDGFYVADDGPGIPVERRDRVFDRGYSESNDGTGFGLAIVSQIVEAHEWSVAVCESDAGGTRFEVRDVEFRECH
ncbi:hybrid sensor histidine kinase/response regulator [Halobacteriales archaeon QH_7_68_42]|nr:MAG: hybrid sensor histidine kinase/response regulator [Halobacteriales archaeon QH_7_68_42]